MFCDPWIVVECYDDKLSRIKWVNFIYGVGEFM